MVLCCAASAVFHQCSSPAARLLHGCSCPHVAVSSSCAACGVRSLGFVNPAMQSCGRSKGRGRVRLLGNRLASSPAVIACEHTAGAPNSTPAAAAASRTVRTGAHTAHRHTSTLAQVIKAFAALSDPHKQRRCAAASHSDIRSPARLSTCISPLRQGQAAGPQQPAHLVY